MRLFFGICLPEEIKDELRNFSSKITGSAKKVSRENYHITLKFIGEADRQEIIDRIKGARFRKFEVSLGNLGFFPDKKRPRVAWIGIDKGNQEIIGIYRSLAQVFGAEKNFVPHITVARIAGQSNAGGLSFDSNSSFLAERITLFSSSLLAEGPVYKKEHEIVLI